MPHIHGITTIAIGYNFFTTSERSWRDRERADFKKLIMASRAAINAIVLLPILMLLTSEVVQSNQNLTFMFITSFGRFGLNSSGAMPAADIALEAINDNPNILPGYNLVYDRVRDSEVSESTCGCYHRFTVLFTTINDLPVMFIIMNTWYNLTYLGINILRVDFITSGFITEYKQLMSDVKLAIAMQH